MKKKKWMVLMIAAGMLLICMGCRVDGEIKSNEKAAEKSEITAAVTYIDALERTIEFSAQELSRIQQGQYRVAVLSGSLAEIWSLAGGSLWAVTEDAYEEEDRILEMTEDTVNMGSLKNPNAEVLAEAGVDLAILSADLEGHVTLKEVLHKLGIKVMYCKVEAFEDYLKVLRIFTELTGCEERYAQYGTAVAERIEKQVKRQWQDREAFGPSVLLLRAYSSGVKAKGSDNMTGWMLRDLGCVNVADAESLLAEELSMEGIIMANPEYIFVTIMGSDEEAALQSVQRLLADNPAWQGLEAIKEGNYYVLPKKLFHNKPNHRWAESYEILADILYPDGEGK